SLVLELRAGGGQERAAEVRRLLGLAPRFPRGDDPLARNYLGHPADPPRVGGGAPRDADRVDDGLARADPRPPRPPYARDEREAARVARESGCARCSRSRPAWATSSARSPR